MKKFYLLLLSLSMGLSNVFADGVERTYTNITAGDLSTQISKDNIDPLTITKLTLTGQLNGTDLRLLREMAGNDYKGQPTEGKLQILDLSGATIVAGGDAYIDLDNNFINLGNNIYFYGFDDTPRTSEANTLGDYLFAGCQQLKTVKTPTSLIKIGSKVFAESGLTTIDLNSGLTTLGHDAFWHSKLSSITIPQTVIHIGDRHWVENPFAYIDNLKSITLEAGNSRYSMSADGKLLIDNTNHAVVCALGNSTIPEGVTAIGSNAFCNRPELVNYTIPDGVVLNSGIYGNNSFSQCVNLVSATLPSPLTIIPYSLFVDCTSLNSVEIPSSVVGIRDYAFSNTALSQITIPKNVTSIGTEAFAHNKNLETVISYITDPFDISDDVFAKGWDLSTTTYPGTLKVPYGTKALYEAKTGWNKIANIVEMSAEPVAEYTDKLGVKYSLNDDESTYSVSGYTDACTGDIIIPSSVNGCSVTSIGDCAFQNCYNLTSVNIPNSVTSIGTLAFQKCTGLTSVTIPNSVTSIGGTAFSSCSALNSVNIPNSVTEIGLGAFNGCGNLTSITIPNSLTSINEYVFASCGLTSVTIPNNVTSIGDGAFSWCKMSSIIIGSGVTSIYHSFNICQNLTDVYCLAENVPNTSPDTFEFSYIGQSTLHVPEQSIDAYKAVEPWKNFKEIVEIAGKLINVEIPGTLSQLISNDEKFTITELTITGKLNGTDLRLLREMAGNDYKGQPTEGKLQKLDLSGATIVAGGDPYIAQDVYFINLGNDNVLFIWDGSQFTSEANTFGRYLFAGCQQLKSVRTPKSLKEIGNKVFAESGLTSIDLNSGLTTIDDNAFWYSKLSSITIPKTVISIGDQYSGDNPFAYIDQLTKITLEAGNYRYSMSADDKLLIDNTKHILVCALGDATIPEGITAIASNAFCNRPELVNFTIPNWVTQIGDNSFSQCYNLESVVISNQITTISNSAFTDCPKLTSVTIPSSVTNIMYNAFGNTGLTEITIPSSVTSINRQAFAHNQNLETVISYITNPFDIDDGVFAISETTYPQILKVPYGTKALYEAKTGWNKFANIVEMAQAPTITITAKSYSRAYGDANPTFESEVTGGTVTGTPSITCAATATSNVGTYDIVITKGTVTNSDVVYVSGTLTITKAPLKITAKSYTQKQGEANPEFGVTYDGFKNNETEAVLTTKPSVTCTATKDSPAGTYDITVSGAVAGNYEISYVKGTLTVEAVPAPEPTPEPKPLPEPKGTIFDLDTDDSSTKEVKITFVVKESDSSGTPTVAISDDKDASGSVAIPEAVTHNGVEYKVTEISEGAFQNNTSLTEVKIPASITSIGANAFAGCKNLQAITINIIVPINIAVISTRGFTRAESGDVFDGVDKENCILYVPEGSVEQYKSAPGWKEFKNILPIKSSTGIHSVEIADGEPFDIFTLSGQKVKSKATSLDGLPRGIYIIKGKKVMK